jgi:hypothetical protein
MKTLKYPGILTLLLALAACSPVRVVTDMDRTVDFHEEPINICAAKIFSDVRYTCMKCIFKHLLNIREDAPLEKGLCIFAA